MTNRRVITVQEGWRRKTSSMYLEAIPSIEREGTMTGTLWFGTKYPIFTGRGSERKTRNMSRFSWGDVPVFADIDDVDSVYRLVVGLKEKARKESNSTTDSAPT
jgi:hypothetical protein